jgi:hypothetical protein
MALVGPLENDDDDDDVTGLIFSALPPLIYTLFSFNLSIYLITWRDWLGLHNMNACIICLSIYDLLPAQSWMAHPSSHSFRHGKVELGAESKSK